MAVGSEGFQQLCLACRRGLEDGEEEVYLPPLELLETLVGVFPEQAWGQRQHLATVFQAAQVSKHHGTVTGKNEARYDLKYVKTKVRHSQKPCVGVNTCVLYRKVFAITRTHGTWYNSADRTSGLYS